MCVSYCVCLIVCVCVCVCVCACLLATGMTQKKNVCGMWTEAGKVLQSKYIVMYNIMLI